MSQGGEYMATYTDSLDGITSEHLNGFFVGWPSPPDPETHLKLLRESTRIVLAVDEKSGNVVGFITAISDGVLSAYIPLLEVLPDYQGQGIGQQLTRRMLDKLGKLYMIDVVCDKELQTFYARFGMKRMTAMMIRNLDKQSGA
jgi:ribosomal protein S18 acetylase RimI-like enzyme